MTTITLGKTYTDVRGGGYGASAWIAQITGTDPKFGLKREFCQKSKNLSGSGRSGTISFDVTKPGVYEFRGFCVGSTARNWEWSGYIELRADAEPRELSKSDVVAMFAAQEA